MIDTPIGARDATRQAPDFTSLALGHLQMRCDTFRQHVRAWLGNHVAADSGLMIEDLQRFRNTLVLLDRTSAVPVVEELLLLLEAVGDGSVTNSDVVPAVLVLASEQLSEHVDRLQKKAGSDNALLLIPLLNDSRVCRGQPLVTGALVQAAGIKLPEPIGGMVTETGVIAEYSMLCENIETARPDMLRNLIAWYRSPIDKPAKVEADKLLHPDHTEGYSEVVRESASALNSLADQFKALADTCANSDALNNWALFFQSGNAVVQGVNQQLIDDSAAVRRVFAQLERSLHRTHRSEGTVGEPPSAVFINLLWFVAQSRADSAEFVVLHRHFRLERIRLPVAVPSGVLSTLDHRIAATIREGIGRDIAVLQQWLSHAQADSPIVEELINRILQLEPVLGLLGMPDALNWLRQVNRKLVMLDGGQTMSSSQRLQLAEYLAGFDRAMSEPHNHRLASEGGYDGAVYTQKRLLTDEAVDACLYEARKTLQVTGSELDEMHKLGRGDASAVQRTAHRFQVLADQLRSVGRSLQMIPLPEVEPLLSGLADCIAKAPIPLVNSRRKSIAKLLASLDYYLGCVLQPQPAASQLLQDAEGSLDELRMSNQADEVDSASEVAHSPVLANPVTPIVITTVVKENAVAGAQSLTDATLEQLNLIGNALASVRQTDEQESRKASLDTLVNAFGELVQAADRTSRQNKSQFADSAREIGSLANAALLRLRIIKQALPVEPVSLDDLALLDEVHAVLPQLVERLHVGSEPVRGLHALLGDLTSGAEVIDQREGVALRQNVNAQDSELVIESIDLGDALTLDNTLQQVFHDECRVHVDTLQYELGQALASGASGVSCVPTENLMRALHTLTGSAQTVDAPEIVALVQPLQRAAIAVHRRAESFNPEQVQQFIRFVDAIEARLQAMSNDEEVNQSVLETERRLPEFVQNVTRQANPKNSHNDDGLLLGRRVRTLADVFDEEADELLSRMHDLTENADAEFGESLVAQALSHLHTLKGSARMAGRPSVADAAHQLEGQVQAMATASDIPAQMRVLRSGRVELQSLLTDRASDNDSTRVQMNGTAAELTVQTSASQLPLGRTVLPSAAHALPDQTFDQLLNLATDVTVSQARLSDDLTQVREICLDLESTAARWRHLAQDAALAESPAVREMLADLEATRQSLAEALRQADAERQQGSRSGAALQQALIRTRLVRVDVASERLTAAVQDATVATGVEAALTIEAGDITLDRMLYQQVLPLLEHMVRNAVVHGIENKRDRLQVDKPEVGSIRLSAHVDGIDLVLSVADDGRGVDRELVNKTLEAREQHSVSTADDLQSVLCEPGFSTLSEVSPLAGRGLGLAAVSQAIARLDGRLVISSQTGQGTTITLRLPQRIIINQVVLVRSGDALFAIPVNFVHAVESIEQTDCRPGFRAIPLSALLGGEPAARANLSRRILLVADRDQIALEVDEVLGFKELVAQPLGPQLTGLQRFTGGSVLPDGRQVLILDLGRLMASPSPVSTRRLNPESMRPVALVVDDSLTMRVATMRMLEERGISAHAARDGIEALDAMAVAWPDLLIVDIDMPRLDGFELLSRLRKEYADSLPPVIMISSRDAQPDRQRAQALGVSHYMVKPWTDALLQDALIDVGLRLPDLTIA